MRKNFFQKLISFFSRTDDMQAEGTQREFGKPEVVNFCKADLGLIGEGMYLFTDNTFSYNLQDGKKVRAVVFSKQGKTIYALLLDEQNLLHEKARDYREYVSQVLVDDAFMRCTKMIPTLELLRTLHWVVKELNHALEVAGQPKLSGLYWSWSNDRPYFMYDIEKGQNELIRKGSCAKLRFILEMKLK